MPALRFVAVLIAVAGALLAFWGLVEWPNFNYTFREKEEVISQARNNALQEGVNWVVFLADNYADQDDWRFQYALDRLTSPYPYLYHVDATGKEGLTSVGDVPDVEAFFAGLPAYQKSKISTDMTIYVGFSSETYNAFVKDYAEKHERGSRGLYLVFIGVVLGLIGAFSVMYSAGRQPRSTEVQISFLDRMYLDVGLIVFVVAFAVALFGGGVSWTIFDRGGPPISLAFGALLAALITLVGLQYLSSVAKRLKRGELFKHTLMYAIIVRIVKLSPLEIQVSGLLLAYGAAVSLSILLLASAGYGNLPVGLFGLVNIVALVYVVSRATELKAIIVGTERVRGGDLSYRIPEKGIAAFVELATNINNIAFGLQAAVESEVKSERMKAELVTNVSHDLKTPLTSIITYVDLLKAEGLNSENAARYLDVLDKKSQRLKVLTDDLFEAAKSASGNLPVKLEVLDVCALLTQGLAELSGRIEDSGLDFRVSLPPDRLEVQADGRLLWRAIENVVSNILNYALAGSRVYVDVVARGRQIQLIFKNISAIPLNIGPEELTERFKRGDESRSTEGSGLGLAIAKSLVELQKGSLKLEIDGDLFKATISLPKYN